MSEKSGKNIYTLGVKNILSSFKSQIIVLLVGIVISFVLPAVIGIEQFGYWQVYLLYVTFAMFFSLGFTDGIYLNYGNFDYENLPYEKLRTTLRIYIFTAIIFTILAILLSFLENDQNKQFALMAASLNIFVLLISNAAITILQFTNRIKEFSFLTATGKLILLFGITTLIILKICNFKSIVVVDLFTKSVILIINVFLIKEVFFGKLTNYKSAFNDWFLNIKSGMNIMLAVYASTLVMNIGRILIERFEGIRIYSSYALAVTISSFFLVFVSTFSLSFYPFLKRIDKKKLPEIYEKTNTFLFFVSFVMLGLYYPLNFLIKNWYNDYIAVIQYLPLFLIMTLMQGKEQFLHITYMKTLRKEGKLLLINVVFSLLASLILIPLYFSSKSVYGIALATSILIIAKSYTLEIYLRTKNLFLGFKNIFIELSLITIYVLMLTFIDTYVSLFAFVLFITIFFFIKIEELISFAKRLITELRT